MNLESKTEMAGVMAAKKAHTRLHSDLLPASKRKPWISPESGQRGSFFLLVFCIYPMLHPSQGYKTHKNDKDPPSTMPQGYWRPLRRLPPISITLLLPTTANGTRSWWRQSTNQNGQTEISQLVGALSPVIFIGLYQGQVKPVSYTHLTLPTRRWV